MTSTLHVGIVGCGLIGNKRARVVRDDPSVHLCCASDVIKSNAETLIKEYADGKGVIYQDWMEMLEKEKLDIVIVATPNKYLKEITIQALRRKMHVLCEKPLGRNAKEAKEVLSTATQNGVIIKVGFNHRYHPAIAEAKELIEGGEIGPLYYLRCRYGHGGRQNFEQEWRADKELCGGGELLDQGVHVVDLFRWFMGDFEEVFGYTPTCFWNMAVEDNAFALFKKRGNQVALMHTSWTQWKNIFSFEIFGEAGYLIVEGLGGSYGPEILKIGKRPRSKGAFIGGVPEEEIITFDGPDISWEAEWKEFLAAIKENRAPLGNGQDGLEANRMIEAVYISARENRPVKISEVK